MFSTTFFKKNILVHSVFFTAAAFVTLHSQSAFAWGFRVLAGGGYENFHVPEQDSGGFSQDAHSLTGGNIELIGQAELIDIVPTVKVIGGVGVKKSFLSFKQTVSGSEVTRKFSPQTFGPEAGIQIGLIPLITVQAVAGYDFGIGGETSKLAGASKAETVTGNFDSQGQFNLAGRALLTLFPLVSAGVEAGWASGKCKFKDKTEDTVSPEYKYTSYHINALVSLSL